MQKKSAGLLMYQIEKGIFYYFLVHPGGPFWKNKDVGSWSIPKGEIEEHEKQNELQTAIREMKEETGIQAKEPFLDLGEIKQKSGKIVHAWAFPGSFSGLLMCQSMVEMEFPPKSGRKIKFPEVDKADMFSLEEAKVKINPAQFELIERFERIVKKDN